MKWWKWIDWCFLAEDERWHLLCAWSLSLKTIKTIEDRLLQCLVSTIKTKSKSTRKKLDKFIEHLWYIKMWYHLFFIFPWSYIMKLELKTIITFPQVKCEKRLFFTPNNWSDCKPDAMKGCSTDNHTND